jgi:ATP-dependent DNA ligase
MRELPAYAQLASPPPQEILECVPPTKLKSRFIEPMLLLRTDKLPEGPGWLHELKFDGYRALAIKTGDRLQPRSRNDNDFGARYPAILKALAPMPDETVIDGEVVALDPEGRRSFNLLQLRLRQGSVAFLRLRRLDPKGEDVMGEPLVKRRHLLEKHVLPKLDEPIRYSSILSGSLKDLIHSVKAQKLEGLIAKRCSTYEPGQNIFQARRMGTRRRRGRIYRRCDARRGRGTARGPQG